ncbi:MAG: hypothetical protein ABIF77_09180 [bacterium]
MAPLITGNTSSGMMSRTAAQVPTATWARISGVMVALTPTSPKATMLWGKISPGWLSGMMKIPASHMTSCLASNRSMGRK